MKTIPIPAELLQKIASYLATKPYSEVAAMLADLQKHWQAAEKAPADG